MAHGRGTIFNVVVRHAWMPIGYPELEGRELVVWTMAQGTKQELVVLRTMLAQTGRYFHNEEELCAVDSQPRRRGIFAPHRLRGPSMEDGGTILTGIEIPGPHDIFIERRSDIVKIGTAQ